MSYTNLKEQAEEEKKEGEIIYLRKYSKANFLENGDNEHLRTIIGINNKAESINSLLNQFEVEAEPDV